MRGAAFERVFGQLLDAEADTLLPDIDIEDLDLDHVALLVIRDGLVAGAVPVEVGHVDHAVDVPWQADEQAEFGDVLDVALDDLPDRVIIGEGLPRILHTLLEAEADAAALGIDVEHRDLDLLAGRDDLAGVDVFLGPTHLRDMYQRLDARLQLDERPVVGDVGDAPLEPGVYRVFGLDALPRVGLELLHAEADALGFRIEADDLNIDGLADIERLRGVVDSPPGNVRNVQKSVDAAEVDEGAVIGDILDHAFENLAFLEVGDQLGASLGAGFLEHGAAGNHDVAAAAVHLQDLERLRRAHEGGDVAHRADIDLAAGKERHGAGEIDGESSLDAAEDDAFDARGLLEGRLQQGPGLLAARLLAGKDGISVTVFVAFQVDVDFVPDLDAGLLALEGEFPEGHAAHRLQADIDHRHVVFDGDDAAFEHGAFHRRRDAKGFLKHLGEVLAGREWLLDGLGAGFSHKFS